MGLMSFSPPVKITSNTIVNIPDFITKFASMVPGVNEPEVLATTEIKVGITNTVNRLADVVISWKPEVSTESSVCPYLQSLGLATPGTYSTSHGLTGPFNLA